MPNFHTACAYACVCVLVSPGAALKGKRPASDNLWSGSDFTDASKIKLDIPPRAMFQRTDTQSPPRVQILGMLDSGTHLLWALLEANLGTEAWSGMCPIPRHGCHMWKHALPGRIVQQTKFLLNKDNRSLVVLAMVRSPLAQIGGFIKAPYGLRGCLRNTNWLNYDENLCHLEMRDRVTLEDQTKLADFPGVTGVWNAYVQGYDNLSLQLDPRAKIVVIEYERLVIEPEKVVLKLAKDLGYLVTEFQSFDDPAKPHGRSHGREEAIEGIRRKTYLDKSPLARYRTRKALCAHLDQGTMGRHSFHIDGHKISYGADCIQARSA